METLKVKKEMLSRLILIVVGLFLLAMALHSLRSGYFNADRFGHRRITAKDEPYRYWTVVGAWSVLSACAIYSGIARRKK
jgi:hypothetical protein